MRNLLINENDAVFELLGERLGKERSGQTSSGDDDLLKGSAVLVNGVLVEEGKTHAGER